mmetsp:Transcript_12383/g.32371  ORF Transcript_12383/g.32371 Transcript_12383/m.32371 type:complete len:393 (-) Transcript_12383:14-1192(-)
MSAHSRPWRLAGPASATIHCPPPTGFATSTASPTAQMWGSLVRMHSSTTMPPRALSLMPARSGSDVSARTPRPRMTTSAGTRWGSPPFAPPSTTSDAFAPDADASNPLIAAPSFTDTPFRSISAASMFAISGSKGAMSCGSASTRVTRRPRLWSCSAISTPMKPPPHTTAVRASLRVIQLCISSMSSRLRRERLPGRSMPGIGGKNGLAPSDKTSSSYVSSYSRPPLTSRTRTVLAALSIAIASVRILTSKSRRALSEAGVWTLSLPRSLISPPSQYGMPQLAIDGSPAFSIITIVARSSSRRARAAADAPPATAPMITIFFGLALLGASRGTGAVVVSDDGAPSSFFSSIAAFPQTAPMNDEVLLLSSTTMLAMLAVQAGVATGLQNGMGI